jgi:hypothetical protein
MRPRENAINWRRAFEVAVFLAILWGVHHVAVGVAHWLFPAAN